MRLRIATYAAIAGLAGCAGAAHPMRHERGFLATDCPASPNIQLIVEQDRMNGVCDDANEKLTSMEMCQVARALTQNAPYQEVGVLIEPGDRATEVAVKEHDALVAQLNSRKINNVAWVHQNGRVTIGVPLRFEFRCVQLRPDGSYLLRFDRIARRSRLSQEQ